MSLAEEVFEKLKEDLENKSFGKYLDTWDYEDEYSHNDIDIARMDFIDMANEYFTINTYPYEAREVNENVYIFNIETGKCLSN